MVKLLYNDENQIVVQVPNQVPNGIGDVMVVKVKDEEIVICGTEFKVINGHIAHKKFEKKVGYGDALLINRVICTIMKPLIEERNKLRYKLTSLQRESKL